MARYKRDVNMATATISGGIALFGNRLFVFEPREGHEKLTKRMRFFL
jgi:hypothetical protein